MRMQTLEDLAQKKRKIRRLASLDLLPQADKRKEKVNFQEAEQDQISKLRLDFQEL